MEINSLRSEIDDINNNLIDLLIKRHEISKKIGKEKHKLGIPIYDPSRESNIFTNIKNKHPNEFKYLVPIFEEIVKQSRLIQN